MARNLVEALKAHTLWLNRRAGGIQLDQPWVDFSGIRFPHCDFRKARLPGAKFVSGDFSEGNFGECDLFAANFEDRKSVV